MAARLGFISPPNLGWNTRDPLSAMKPGFAPIFDNYVVENGLPIVRRGFGVWSTGLPGRVDGLLSWSGAGVAGKLFASSGTGIYDATTAGAVGSAAVSGLTSARWSGIMVAASGGNFLFAFNGADTPQTFNGTTWANWTGTGVTGGVSWAAAMNGRLFVGNAGRLSFFYGGAGAIGGTFTEFPLQGIAQRGGGVVACGIISGDGGSGPRSLTVFITDQGEAIVYAGTDPSDPAAWSLVGRWRVPRPVGAPHRCLAAWGGDVLLMTEAGVIPLSTLQTGMDAVTVIDRNGVTRSITPTWRALTAARGTESGWGITPLTALNLVVHNVPWGTTAQQIVVSEGGALSRWSNIPAAVWIEALGSRAFAGDSTAGGRVFLYGEAIADLGLGIRSEAMPAFDVLRTPGRIKRVNMAQAILRDAADATPEIAIQADWLVPTPQMDALGPTAGSPALPIYGGAAGLLVWASGEWGVNLWGGGVNDMRLPWSGTTALTQAIAPRLRMVSGNGRPAWLGTNVAFDVGNPFR